MPLYCPAQHKSESDVALRCAECGAKLTRLAVGETVADTGLRVAQLVHDHDTSLIFLARDAQQKSFLVSEYFPHQAADAALKKRFHAGVRLLQELGAPASPIASIFTRHGLCYKVETLGGGRLLADELNGGNLHPRTAGRVLDGICTQLKALHLHKERLYHGNIHAKTIVHLPDGGVFLVGSSYPGWLLAAHEPDTATMVRTDLANTGRVLEAALTSPEKGSAKPALPMEWAATIDFLIGEEGKEAPSVEAVEELRHLLRQVQADPDAAASLLDQAFNLSGSPSLKPLLDTLKNGKPKPTKSAGKREQPLPESTPQPAATAVATAAAAVAAAPIVQPAPVPAEPQPVAPVDSPPPAPKAPVEPSGVMFCSHCGPVTDLEANHCLDCGRPLRYYAANEALPPITPPLPVVPVQSAGKGKWVAAAAVLALIGFLVYYISTTQDRKFDQAIASLDLVSSASDSAFSIREQARQAGNLSRARDMDLRAAPVLEARSNQLFDRWHKESDLIDSTWRDILVLERWRAEINPSTTVRARLVYAEARVALDEKRFAEAIDLFRQSLGLQPNWVLAWNGMGVACVNLANQRKPCREGEIQRSVEYFYLRARDADPSWPFSYQNLGGVYLRQNNFAVSEQMYRQAVSIDPQRPGSRFLLGEMLLTRGSPRRAEACTELREAVRLAANRPRPGFNVSYAEGRIQRYC